jgi:hypothetical protein
MDLNLIVDFEEAPCPRCGTLFQYAKGAPWKVGTDTFDIYLSFFLSDRAPPEYVLLSCKSQGLYA